MNVRLKFDARTFKGRFALLEHAAHGVKRAVVNVADDGDGVVEHEAVAVAFEPVVIALARAFVFGKGLALRGEFLRKDAGDGREFGGKADVEQVEAVAELDDGPEDGGAFDAPAFPAGLRAGPLKGASRAVFPKINAGAEPVVSV